jgi:hypothetical protein
MARDHGSSAEFVGYEPAKLARPSTVFHFHTIEEAREAAAKWLEGQT